MTDKQTVDPNPERDERVTTNSTEERMTISAALAMAQQICHERFCDPHPMGQSEACKTMLEAIALLDRPAAGDALRWSKEAPAVDGVYWWRADERDNDPDIHLVQGEFFYQVGFGSSELVANFDGEWRGPITPTSISDTATRMREACVNRVKEYLRRAKNIDIAPLIDDLNSMTLDQVEQEKR